MGGLRLLCQLKLRSHQECRWNLCVFSPQPAVHHIPGFEVTPFSSLQLLRPAPLAPSPPLLAPSAIRRSRGGLPWTLVCSPASAGNASVLA